MRTVRHYFMDYSHCIELHNATRKGQKIIWNSTKDYTPKQMVDIFKTIYELGREDQREDIVEAMRQK